MHCSLRNKQKCPKRNNCAILKKVRKKFLNPFFYQDPHQKWLWFCTKTHPASKFHRNLLSCFCVMLLTNQQTWHVVQSPRDLACGPCMEITLWIYRFKLWLYWSRHVSAEEYIFVFFGGYTCSTQKSQVLWVTSHFHFWDCVVWVGL